VAIPTGFLTPTRFDLRSTMESGQFFRWRLEDGAYVVQTGRSLFRVSQEEGRLSYEGAPALQVAGFLGLEDDLEAIESSLSADRRLAPALEAHPGLRLLRQDPWECLCAFMTSVASSIPRIARNLESIAQTFGRPLRRGPLQGQAFPRPGELGGEAVLRRLGLGFRAASLARAARLVRTGLLDEVGRLDTDAAREALCVIPGVAEKVADCVLLFAYGRGTAFPVDTWIRKIMTKLYFRGRKTSDDRIRGYAVDRWGELAGYAQQYLYHWARSGGLQRGAP
jgi:N-glycosylase/DNA lyase